MVACTNRIGSLGKVVDVNDGHDGVWVRLLVLRDPVEGRHHLCFVSLQRRQPMQIISFINPKGGCGKTTLVTSLAAKLACDGHAVALRDMDRQMSAREWSDRRPKDRPPVAALGGGAQQIYQPTFGRDFVIQDTESAVYGYDLLRLLVWVDIAVIPVGPSSLDFEVSARLLERLKHVPRVASKRCKLLCVGNRWPSEMAEELGARLADPRLPISAVLTEHSAYARAVERGVGVLELGLPRSDPVHDEWALFVNCIKESVLAD